MPGGLLQLVGKGAQDQLVTGNPSFTHFRSVYKRHTDFAMEHFRLYFKTSILSYPMSGTLRLRTKVERYAQLLNDCYLSIDLPNIYSPVVPVSGFPTTGTESINATSNAIGYEFQWIRNIGYNMIHHVSILVNGQEIVRHTGEWMKLYANMTFDANKRAILDRMVGNVPELYDPANAQGRLNQYPHSITSSDQNAEPSIPGRTLLIPLHFWFCETVGQALPMVALQQSEVEIVVELYNAYSLFTVRDVRSMLTNTASNPLFGNRIAPDASNVNFGMSHFLSPPIYNSTSNVVPDLRTWNFNPFLECNYIFLSDTELAYVARNEHSFMISQIDMVQADNQYGPSNDLELTMKNLVSRIIWVFQRSDLKDKNVPDNYTNWVDPYRSPFESSSLGWYTSGTMQDTNVSQKDILIESTLMLDGQERFAPKQTLFFSGLEMYRHQTGNPISGIYEYSFALNNDPTQPSGSINGSMFNKTLLRNTLITPPGTTNGIPANGPAVVCILKSTAGSKNPIIVLPAQTRPTIGPNGQVIPALYGPEDVITIVSKSDGTPLVTYQYTYTVRAYVQSYNFLRIVGGIGNVVFSS